MEGAYNALASLPEQGRSRRRGGHPAGAPITHEMEGPMFRTHSRWTIALLLAALPAALPLACSDSSPTAPERDIASLRRATDRFHDFPTAQGAGYGFLFMDMCMADQSAERLGGMGFHYVNTNLLDATVDVSAPEALLYETGPQGQLRLMAVEYVIPKDAWTSAKPPVLFGREFKLNAFDLWALHVWVWKNNPSGTFADWNPDVTCQ
jgi:hypothetical protein